MNVDEGAERQAAKLTRLPRKIANLRFEALIIKALHRSAEDFNCT